MERHTEIVRQWRLLLALEGRARGLTLADLQTAAGDGVSDRTIRRDLNALAQAGFPIVGDRKYGGRTQFPNGIALHSRRLVVEHPVRRGQVTFIAPLPPSWSKFVSVPDFSR